MILNSRLAKSWFQWCNRFGAVIQFHFFYISWTDIKQAKDLAIDFLVHISELYISRLSLWTRENDKNIWTFKPWHMCFVAMNIDYRPLFTGKTNIVAKFENNTKGGTKKSWMKNKKKCAHKTECTNWTYVRICHRIIRMKSNCVLFCSVVRGCWKKPML